MRKNIFRKLLEYFLRGILVTVPMGATVYVIFKIFVLIDGIIPIDIPGLGIITLVALITLFGWIGTSIIAQPIFNYFQQLIDKAPLIKTIYSAVKDLVSAFVGQKKKFNQPVLVKFTKDSDLLKPGFVTREDLSILGIEKGKVAVYLPHSYAWSGNLFIVPQENVTPINASSSDMMKFIISGGVSAMEDEEEKTITSL